MDAAAVGPLPTGDWVRAPALGTTYQPRHPLLTEATLPFLDVLEVSPDSLVESTDGPVLGGQALEELRHLSTDVAIVAHGVGLSLASYDSWWDGYLRCLDQLASAVPLQWHSEHLGYTRVNGEFFGTMLPAPRTEEMLALLITRISLLRRRYQIPFLIENVVGLLPDYPSQYSQAGFLNRIVEATGCGLLLDVYNLRCDEANRGLVIEEFLDELQLEAVVEVHVAGGVEYLGFTLDVHSRAPLLTTLELARQVITRCPNLRLVTYELMEEAVTPLGAPAIVNSLRMTRAIALSGHRRGVGPRRSTGRVSAVR
jgi:uncharacterized protein (UPF0276 family)